MQLSVLLRRHPRVASSLLGAALVVLVLALGELVAGLFLEPEHGWWRTAPFRVQNPDGMPGYDLRPASGGAKALLDGDDPIWEMSWTHDALRRRYTPVAQPETRHRYALFFGGSFAYGTGCDDDETLPYYFGRYAPDYRPYNYGVGGHGVANALYKASMRNLREEVDGEGGIAVYVLIADHVGRMVGSMRHSASWAFPHYERDASGRLVFRGDKWQARPVVTTIYALLQHSNILKLAGVNFPPRYRDRHYDRFADHVEALRDAILDDLPDTRFVVLFYADREPGGEALLTRLDAADIPVYRVSKLMAGLPEPPPPPYKDGHPRPRHHELVARELTEALGIRAEPPGEADEHAPAQGFAAADAYFTTTKSPMTSASMPQE